MLFLIITLRLALKANIAASVTAATLAGSGFFFFLFFSSRLGLRAKNTENSSPLSEPSALRGLTRPLPVPVTESGEEVWNF